VEEGKGGGRGGVGGLEVFCGGRGVRGVDGGLGCGSERGGTEGMSLKDQGVTGVKNRVRVAER